MFVKFVASVEFFVSFGVYSFYFFVGCVCVCGRCVCVCWSCVCVCVQCVCVWVVCVCVCGRCVCVLWCVCVVRERLKRRIVRGHLALLDLDLLSAWWVLLGFHLRVRA